MGGATRLMLQGEITILPGDTSKSLDKIFTNDDPEYKFDGKEDVLLNMVNKSETPVSIVVYGGKHSFGARDDRDNNIEKWNEQHPDSKFNLIEITPKNYNLPD